MGHQDRRLAPLADDPPELLAKLAAKRGVHGRERLVQEEQVRIHGQRAAQGDALLLAARELARIPSLEAGQAETLEHLPRSLATLLPGTPLEAEGDILLDGQVGEKRVALKDVPEASVLRPEIHPGGAVEEDPVVERDAPLVRAHEARQALERQRLAGAVGTEEGHDLVAGLPADIEGEPVKALLDRQGKHARAPST